MPHLDVVWLGQLWDTQAMSVSLSPDILLQVWRSLFLAVMSVSLTGVGR